jgi:hypothetical protein
MGATGDLEAMIDELTNVMADAEKHDRGNNAAGGRLRKALMNTKKACDVCLLQQNTTIMLLSICHYVRQFIYHCL